MPQALCWHLFNKNHKKLVYCIFKSTFYLKQLFSCLQFSTELCWVSMISDGVTFWCQSDTRKTEPPKQKLGEQQSRDFHWRLQWFNDGLRKSNPGGNLWLVLAAATPPGSSTTAFISWGSTSLILPDIQTPWLNIKFLFPKYVSQYPITCYHSSIISWRLLSFGFFFITLIRNSNSHLNTETKIDYICK